MPKNLGWDDTIVALATPPGVGAIGVIRLSGKLAIGIAAELFGGKDLREQASHTLHVGMLRYKEQVLDEAVVSLYRAPRSYTGEDVVEISCHGSPYVQQQVIDACVGCGSRLAGPGEFTFRAFINGKIDLAQAEAVADLIAAGTKASRDTALHAMRGGFSKALSDLRGQMVKFSALIELELDFAGEDVEFADRTQFYALLGDARRVVKRLLESFAYGNVVKYGVRVAIVGKPNAGKSTLLNNLLNENRAIVSDIAGTTRDTIEEVLNINGILFRLIDTAGIREHTADIIEKAGMEKTFEKIREADVVLYVFDASLPDELMNGNNVLRVGNKVDLIGDIPRQDGVIYISARNDAHLDELKERLFAMAVSGTVSADDTIVTNARHYEALRDVDSSIDDIIRGLDANLPGDLLALDIRRCLHSLGEITGEITNEEQLGWIFGKFCIGK